MAIYEMTSESLVHVPSTSFAAHGVRERYDLQRVLRERIDAVAPDVLILAEEFGKFEGARRRIDLLGLHKDGRLVVIELKRTDDGGYMDLQAIRYAAMVSAMTFDQAVEQRALFVQARNIQEPDSAVKLREWLSGEETLEDDVRIVLVAADFGVELTTAVLWLTQRHDLDILCVRVAPYVLDDRLLLDIQQVIPLPEAADYQVGLRRKDQQAREVTGEGRDYTRYVLVLDGAPTRDLSKQQAVKQAVAFLAAKGIPLLSIRTAVGNRWRPVEAATPDEVPTAFEATFGRRGHWWPDAPYADEETPGLWWVMLRVGGRETEDVLGRLRALSPDSVSWRRAEIVPP